MSKVAPLQRSSTSYFASPVPYESKEVRKTVMVTLSRDDDGRSFVKHECVEDNMSKQIQLDFQEVLLSNLIAKGVNPHGLDMVEVSKIGIDHGVEMVANEIVSNLDKYFVKGDNYNKEEKL